MFCLEVEWRKRSDMHFDSEVKMMVKPYFLQKIWFSVLSVRSYSKPHRSAHVNLLTMKRQWAYGLTLLSWSDHFHTSLACFTAL